VTARSSTCSWSALNFVTLYTLNFALICIRSSLVGAALRSLLPRGDGGCQHREAVGSRSLGPCDTGFPIGTPLAAAHAGVGNMPWLAMRDPVKPHGGSGRR